MEAFAIKVSDRFHNTIWLGHADGPAKTIAKDDFNLTRGKRFQFGQGIYTAPDINVAEKYARQFSYQNERYLVVSQNRVNPATLIKISADQTGVMEYWINPSDQDVRPYG
ncbi:unnamed protein product, partial [Rotaria magnacalcarata]